MSLIERNSQISLWMKVGFFGVLGGILGFVIDLLGFRMLGTIAIWVGWTVAAVGLVGDRIVRFQKK